MIPDKPYTRDEINQLSESQIRERMQLIKCHALEELSFKPLSVTAHDRLFLIFALERFLKTESNA